MSTTTQTTKRSKNELPASMIPVESTAARAKKMREAAKQPSAYDLAVTITLNALYRDVKSLDRNDIESPFESGKEQDANAGWAIDLVVKEVYGMMGRSVTPVELEVWLCGVGGIVSCAYQSLSDKDTVYGRYLKAMASKIKVFAEMLELAEMDGEKFLQREVRS